MDLKVQSLLFAVVQEEDADPALDALTRTGLRATRISSIGGFLDRGNATLLLGLARGEVERAIQLLAENCRQRTTLINASPQVVVPSSPGLITPVEVEIGGATIMQLPVKRYVRMNGHTELEDEATGASDGNGQAMQLIIAILPTAFSRRVLDALMAAHLQATRISSTGGFLRRGNTTLLIGVPSTRVNSALKCIESACAEPMRKPPDAACATVFVLDMERHLRV
jgi:uncharacterized protein YaaQ